MNQIIISETQQLKTKDNILLVSFSQADKILQILRNEHFTRVTIDLPRNLNHNQLRFMMHLNRIIKKNGQIYIKNHIQSEQANLFTTVAKKLGLFIHKNQQNQIFFSKMKPEDNKHQQAQLNKKLAIGFKSIQEQQIDQEDLMQNENINIKKQKTENCAQKPRACANCNCGRKDNQTPLLSKEELVQSVNEGKPVSGCGKCYLGDSFRCGSCPYKGLPAFKPGDKLKLMDEGQVLVQTGNVKVESGKVKLQL